MSSLFYIILCLLVVLFLTFVVFLVVFIEAVPLKVFLHTIGRDMRAVLRYARSQIDLRRFCHRDQCIGEIFSELVRKHPNKTCFIYEDEKWSYQKVEDVSNKIANLFHVAGYQKGDEVALFMGNRPEYVCIWLGLSKIGVVPALINTNQKSHALAHSINVINSKAVIFNAELASAVREVYPLLNHKETLGFYCLDKYDAGDANTFIVKSLDELLEEASKAPINTKKHDVGFNDKLFYIYTSGTTGLPKAAIIRQKRFMWVGAGSYYVLAMKQDDVYYNTLPLYHTSGGVFFISVLLMYGGSMVIRKKFSATNFWKDAIKYNATVGQYIGEICRYLLNQPKSAYDTSHSIRLMTGNGLNSRIWREFQERFKIEDIIEFYGATEGNANVVNVFGRVGAVGFVSRIFSKIHPVYLIRVDSETREPIRGKNGLCIRCKPGEPGEMVGKIVRSNPVNDFDGYVNEQATKKKIITDCFNKGDTAFLSGDILVMDEYGYLYFQDRTGETFRWRGENVSTCEVESIISKILGPITCVVYGVEIPGMEGRAGMAAIQNGSTLDVDRLYKELLKSLPSYAVPRFIRICEKIETTGTYKLKKVNLQKEGFNINEVTDRLFVMDLKKQTYSELSQDLYDQIINGNSRL